MVTNVTETCCKILFILKRYQRYIYNSKSYKDKYAEAINFKAKN